MSAKKKIIIIVGVLLALAVVIGISVNASRKDLISVETGLVERRTDLVSVVSATGEIKPKEYVELQAEISGVITELFVQEGDFVDKGGLLLKIDPIQTESETRAQEALLLSAQSEARSQKAQIAVQESNIQRDKAGVRAAEVEVERAQQNFELAKATFERKQGIYEDNLLSKDEYEAVKNSFVNARTSLAAAEVQLEQAIAQYRVSEVVLQQAKEGYESSLNRVSQQTAFLERSRNLLSKTKIRSPLAGVITQLNVEVGERAVPGTLNNPAATLMIIADLSVIEAEVEVDETDIVDLELGQQASVKVDALPDTPITGTVTEIGNSAIPTATQQEAKDFKVVIQLKDPPKSLRPGLSCTGEITTATRSEVLTIPIQALTIREFPVDDEGNMVRKEQEEDGEDKELDSEDSKLEETEEFEGVFVIREDEAFFVPVDTGIMGESDIEVLEGLEEGQTIITGSYKTLRTLNEGDAVKSENERG